jgi:hypothetical protein
MVIDRGRLIEHRICLGVLCQNLQVSDYGVAYGVGREELIAAAFDILVNFSYALENMQEIGAIIPHSGTASLRTRSRMSGLRPFSVRTSTRRPSSCSNSATKPPGNQGVTIETGQTALANAQ